MKPMALDWLHLAALLGSAQGFLLAGVLAIQGRNRTGNRLLSVAMVTFSIYLLTVVYHAVQFERVFPHFFGVAFPMPLLYGPLIYLYAITTSDRARHLRRRDVLHFLPFATVVIARDPMGNLGSDLSDGSFVISDAVSSAEDHATAYRVGAVSPNPMRSVARIDFSLPVSGRVRIRVFDVRGREVAVLVDAVHAAGNHGLQWNGRSSSGRRAPVGVYFVRLEVGGKQFVREVSLVR